MSFSLDVRFECILNPVFKKYKSKRFLCFSHFIDENVGSSFL